MRWAILLCPFMTIFLGCSMPGRSFTGALPPATPAQLSLAEQIRKDVTYLAGEIGHRDTDHPKALARAADYIEAELGAAGPPVTRHPYTVANQTGFNLAAEI